MRRPEENKIFILAGNEKQANDWAHFNCLGREQYVYLSSPAMAMGLHDFKYVKIGTYHEKPIEERADMMNQLCACGAIEVTIP